jgi:peptide/nickel transport system ATP-binding protein
LAVERLLALADVGAMTALLEINDLSVAFRPRSLGGWFHRRAGRALNAVNGLSLELDRGQSLAIVGEAGCGKQRLTRAILRLTDIAAGDIHLDGQSLRVMRGPATAKFRRQVQMVTGDPVAALNPRLSIAETLAEPLRTARICPAREVPARVDALMTRVGLVPERRGDRPAALSPGECQRVAIARALSVEPELLLANDAIAGLDISIQAQIVNLLADLQHELKFALICIADDVRSVRHLCRNLAVMYLGRIVEQGTMEEILARPRHPYTQALLAATPKMRADAPPPLATLTGEPPRGAELPPGCPFHPRCAKAKPVCATGSPPVRRVDGGVTVWCHLYPEGPALRR